MSDDVNYINLERLRTFLQEVKRLIPTNYATKIDLNNYFPKSGGQLSGDITSSNDGYLALCGGENSNKGPNLQLIGDNWHSDSRGSFVLLARNSDGDYTFMRGTPTGSLTWGNKNIDVIEEQGEGYIRYSNGLQICWGSGANYSQAGKGIEVTQFPKAFSENPSISVNMDETTDVYSYVCQAHDIKTTFFLIYTYSSQNWLRVHDSAKFSWQAIGRWK